MTKEAEMVAKMVEGLAPYLVEVCEVQLLDYGESSGTGEWIKVRFPDYGHVVKFRGKDKASKTKCGQRYTLMMIEIQDDETPVNQDKRERLEHAEEVKGGKHSIRAARRCRSLEFIAWINEMYDVNPDIKDEEAAKNYIYHRCGITSRRQLDHNEEALQKFNELDSEFIKWRESASS